MNSGITIFAIPKPFRGHAGTIQRNALQSWALLPGAIEIILFGDDDGVAEAARDHGAIHIPMIEKTEMGTPIVSAAFETAASSSTSPLLCYVNADIILFEDFVHALRAIPMSRFLAVGRRWDIDIKKPLLWKGAAQIESFKRAAREEACPATAWHMDYFAFPREIHWSLLPFAVGRAGWDAWLIHRAREMKVPIVDVSRSVFVLHQNHGYGHVPDAAGRAWLGPETDQNMDLIGSHDRTGSLFDATHELAEGVLRRTKGYEHMRARAIRFAAIHPRAKVLVLALGNVVRTIRRGLRRRPHGRSR